MYNRYSEDFLINVNCKLIDTELPLLPSSSVPLCLTGTEDGIRALMPLSRKPSGKGHSPVHTVPL